MLAIRFYMYIGYAGIQYVVSLKHIGVSLIGVSLKKLHRPSEEHN